MHGIEDMHATTPVPRASQLLTLIKTCWPGETAVEEIVHTPQLVDGGCRLCVRARQIDNVY
jgi:hypothetical protein